MRIICFLAVLMAAATQCLAWDTYVGRNMSATVMGVPAGNLLTVKGDNGREFSVKLYGVGIPNMRQPMGKQAQALMAKLLPKGAKVTMTTVNEDNEGIVSALVQVKDMSVNNKMVSEGLGWVDRSTCKAFFCRRMHIEEHQAQMDRKGVWSLNISTPPWQWGDQKGAQR